jgi:hypothetical protein
LPKVGQNGTDIFKLEGKNRKNLVKLSYEMVGNFNNFKAFVMFAVKKLEALFS